MRAGGGVPRSTRRTEVTVLQGGEVVRGAVARVVQGHLPPERRAVVELGLHYTYKKYNKKCARMTCMSVCPYACSIHVHTVIAALRPLLQRRSCSVHACILLLPLPCYVYSTCL